MWRFLWLGTLLIAYTLPWLLHPSAALTLNAYDLAEWSALLASSQNRPDALTVALLLRLPLTIIVALAILTLPDLPKNLRWLGYFFGGALVLSQLPPPDAIFSAFSNPNNSQQLALAVSSVFILAVPSYRLPSRIRLAMTVFLTLAAAVLAVVGLAEAQRYFSTFSIAPTAGAGAMSTIALLALGSLSIAATHWQRSIVHPSYALSTLR